MQAVVSGSDSELDPVTVNAYVIGQLRGCRWTARNAAVGEPESAAVPWANQAFALDAALVQGRAVVAAGGAHRMQLPGHVGQDHLLAGHLDPQQAIRGHVGSGGGVGPLARLLLLVGVSIDTHALAVREVPAEVAADPQTRGAEQGKRAPTGVIATAAGQPARRVHNRGEVVGGGMDEPHPLGPLESPELGPVGPTGGGRGRDQQNACADEALRGTVTITSCREVEQRGAGLHADR